MSTQSQLSIPYKDKIIPAVIDCLSMEKSDLNGKLWIALTHGAGGDLKTLQLASIASFLSKKGFVVLRFTCKGLNIKYRVKVFSEVLNFVHKAYQPKGIFIGGRSMGARAAVMLCSDTEILNNDSLGSKLLGVICLSYPLHKPSNISDLRDEPLKRSKKPIFFLSGTEDEMCKRHVFEDVLCSMESPFKVHWLEGCNHSAQPSKNCPEDMDCKAFEEIASWCICIGEKRVIFS